MADGSSLTYSLSMHVTNKLPGGTLLRCWSLYTYVSKRLSGGSTVWLQCRQDTQSSGHYYLLSARYWQGYFPHGAVSVWQAVNQHAAQLAEPARAGVKPVQTLLADTCQDVALLQGHGQHPSDCVMTAKDDHHSLRSE